MAEARALDLPAWRLEFPEHAHPRLVRAFELDDFRKALAWVNRVGMLSEEEGHHPDFRIYSYRNVELTLWTHAVGGLSDNDFVLAAKIDALATKDGLDG